MPFLDLTIQRVISLLTIYTLIACNREAADNNYSWQLTVYALSVSGSHIPYAYIKHSVKHTRCPAHDSCMYMDCIHKLQRQIYIKAYADFVHTVSACLKQDYLTGCK